MPEPRPMESKHQPLAPLPVFLRRLARNFLVSTAIVLVSLTMGTAGYSYFGNLKLIDGLLNASMILTGMGPVDKMETDGGKLFASFYALYSGLAFLTMAAVLLAPVYHRLLHRFHLCDEDRDDDAEPRSAT